MGSTSSTVRFRLALDPASFSFNSCVDAMLLVAFDVRSVLMPLVDPTRLARVLEDIINQSIIHSMNAAMWWTFSELPITWRNTEGYAW